MMRDSSPTLPSPLMRRLYEDFGALPDTIESLGGMSSGRVYRASRAGQALIIKHTVGTMERQFYQQIAPRWSAIQRHTPRLYWALHVEGEWWLALEAIPQTLPPQRRLADPELLAILRHLHQSTIGTSLPEEGRYQPSWAATLTQRALNNLAPAAPQALATMLERYREEAQEFFAPTHLISGDPNPANWGLRDDGSLVLFDWERFTLGTPALDLAITIPGLGRWDDYALVAATYLALADTAAPEMVARLTRAIALAKLWTVMEFLAHHSLADAHTAPTARWLKREVPGWLRLLSQELR